MGDLNEKLGQKAEYRNYIVSQSLYAITNDNGTKLFNFAVGKGLVIKSTMFPKKDIHKYTWISPDGRHRNQIDYVLVLNRFKNSIVNIRTLCGADTDSNHLLLGIWIKVKLLRLFKTDNKKTGQFYINKLEDPAISKIFENNIKSEL